MSPLIQSLQPMLDTANYVDLFWLTFLLMPTVVALPLVVYWVILQALSLIRSII